MFDTGSLGEVEMLALNDLVEGSFSDDILGLWDADDDLSQDGTEVCHTSPKPNSDDAHSPTGIKSETESKEPKKQQRNMRKAEAARVARLRRKRYVQDLEEEVKRLRTDVSSLETQMSHTSYSRSGRVSRRGGNDTHGKRRKVEVTTQEIGTQTDAAPSAAATTQTQQTETEGAAVSVVQSGIAAKLQSDSCTSRSVQQLQEMARVSQQRMWLQDLYNLQFMVSQQKVFPPTSTAGVTWACGDSQLDISLIGQDKFIFNQQAPVVLAPSS